MPDSLIEELSKDVSSGLFGVSLCSQAAETKEAHGANLSVLLGSCLIDSSSKMRDACGGV